MIQHTMNALIGSTDQHFGTMQQRTSFIRKVIVGALAGTIISTLPGIHADVAPANAPDFQEVYRLVQEHLTTRNRDELNSAAVQALLEALPDEVTLSDLANEKDTSANWISKTEVFQGIFAYIRIDQVSAGLKDQILAELNRLNSNGKFAGLAIDLRFASGSDYSEAARVADLFLKGGQELMDWGAGMMVTTEAQPLKNLPTIFLVNSKTAVAAETLSALLQNHDSAVLVGSPTAGHALAYKEFLLQNGQRLRVASGRVKLPGGIEIPATGVVPDLKVTVSPDLELKYMEDPYYAPEGSSSSRRINEADLVRMKQEELNGSGSSQDQEESGNKSKPAPGDSDANMIRDPSLARAMDILKGLTIFGTR